jgi:hypothetical protein
LIKDLKQEKFILNGMMQMKNWLILIYIKNNSPDEGIIIEDKTNPEKTHDMNFNQMKYLKLQM